MLKGVLRLIGEAWSRTVNKERSDRDRMWAARWRARLSSERSQASCLHCIGYMRGLGGTQEKEEKKGGAGEAPPCVITMDDG
jgi:hypothetical protein